LGARAETLAGLSGFGDLVLTCTSAQSRNFRFGCALGKGEAFDPRSPSKAWRPPAPWCDWRRRGIDMPVTAMVDALALGRQIALNDAIGLLMSRPLKQE
jgi:glycerol-3-phosphate dehydrogenase (NAD(P)+)